MKIGFIGLGQMGAPIALNLIKAGHELKVWNRSSEKTIPLIAAGAQAAKDPQDCASQDIVFSILSDDQAAENIAFGPSGLLKNHHPTLHVTMSTISPALVDCMAAAHRSQGGDLVSAPVFGRPLAAQAAKLFIIAAGTEKSLDLCEPLFNIIGQRTIRVGAAPQAANLIKLCGNFMIMSAVESLAEAMTLAKKSGVDKKTLLHALTSTIFTAPLYETYGQILIEQKFKPAGFAAPLGLKDMKLVSQVAETSRTPMPFLGILRDHILSAIAQEGEDVDWSAIAQVVEKDAAAH